MLLYSSMRYPKEVPTSSRVSSSLYLIIYIRSIEWGSSG